MKLQRIIRFTAGILLFALIAALLPACAGQNDFIVSRMAEADAYILDMERMTGTDRHTLKLDAGDTLDVRFEAKEGSVYMEIKAPDGTAVYTGRGRDTSDFTVNISESGVYTVAVEARRAKGIIHISVID